MYNLGPKTARLRATPLAQANSQNVTYPRSAQLRRVRPAMIVPDLR